MRRFALSTGTFPVSSLSSSYAQQQLVGRPTGARWPTTSRTIWARRSGGGEVVAQPFGVTFPIHTDRFQHITTRFQATGIGCAAINSFMYKDIRDPCWLNASSEGG